MNHSASWRRKVNRVAAPGCSILGVLGIFGAIVFFPPGNVQIALITIGILVMEAGVYYMANPIFTSERRYPGLRGEVDDFIGLVRQLNRMGVAKASPEEFEVVQTAMRSSIDRMTELAGKPDTAPAATDESERGGTPDEAPAT